MRMPKITILILALTSSGHAHLQLADDPDVYIPESETKVWPSSLQSNFSFDRNGVGLLLPNAQKSISTNTESLLRSKSTSLKSWPHKASATLGTESISIDLGDLFPIDIDPDPTEVLNNVLDRLKKEAESAAKNTGDLISDFGRLADPERIKIDLSIYAPDKIPWDKIDIPNVNWPTVKIEKIDWSKLDVSKIRWNELDVSKVPWTEVDPKKLNWGALGLDQVPFDILPKNWTNTAKQMQALYKQDFKKMFAEESKNLSWSTIKDKGKDILSDIIIKEARKCADSPQGLEIRSVIVKNHPWFEQTKLAVKFAKDIGLIKTKSECQQINEVIAIGVETYAEKQAGPITGEAMGMFASDMGTHSCNAAFPNNPSIPAPPQWAPGKSHPFEPNLVGSAIKDHWHPRPGYVWINKKTLTVAWQEGLRHPDNPHCISSATKNTWHPEPGYKIDPGAPTPPNVIARTLAGIGATMDTDPDSGYIKIIEVARGGSLEENKIHAGSLILSIDGMSTYHCPPRTFAHKEAAGPAGTNVRLVIYSFDTKQREAIDVIRKEIPSQAYDGVPWQFLEENKKLRNKLFN